MIRALSMVGALVFASTDKGGVGMNVQKRLVAIHEIDAPRAQRPGDLRQRMGRGIRQGNIYDEVRLLRYVTKGTTDEVNYCFSQITEQADLEARLLAATPVKPVIVAEPPAAKPLSPMPKSEPVAAVSALTVNKDQRAMSRGDVEKLKRVQDENAYGLSFGGGLKTPDAVGLIVAGTGTITQKVEPALAGAALGPGSGVAGQPGRAQCLGLAAGRNRGRAQGAGAGPAAGHVQGL